MVISTELSNGQCYIPNWTILGGIKRGVCEGG